MGVQRFLVVVLLAALLAPPTAFATQPISTLLTKAELARSSDPVAFQKTVAELNGRAASATPDEKLRLLYLNAYARAITGNIDGSIELGRKLLEASRTNAMKLKAGALLVNNYALNGHYNEGLRQLEQTFALLDQAGDPGVREHLFISAATLYNQVGQYKLAEHYASLVEAAPSSGRSLCFASYYKFEAMQELGDLPRSDTPLLKAVDNCDGEHEVMMANLIRVTLAKKWIAQGEKSQAFDLLAKHLAEAESTRYPRVIAEMRSMLADMAFSNGDLAGAEVNAKATVENSENILNTPPVVSALLTLYRIADRRRDSIEALAAYKRYAEAERGFLEEVKARELAYHLVRQEARQKNQQIQLLDRQNRLLQLQQRVDKQKAENSRMLMLLFAAFALIIAYWGYKTRRLHVSLRRMAQTDALTGICNRHHFTAQAEKMLGHCAKVGEQVSLIMFDLDHFKLINDTYGHVAGDWVLKEVARTCAELCRRMDYFGRLGGEEFAILLQGCDARAATRIADDCRMRIAHIQSAPSGHAFKITASFGVSCAMDSGYDLDKLISHADQMLYRAKHDGRNRVKTYTHDVPMETREPAPWHESVNPAANPDLSAMGALKV